MARVHLWTTSIIFTLTLLCSAYCENGMLYPIDSESRQSKLLDGIWMFRTDTSLSRNDSFINKWWEKELRVSGPVLDMPVPSSYNDVTQDKYLRDFVGWAWYERNVYVSHDWTPHRTVLRFDSAHYFTKVWLNGEFVMEHNGGHLPFECEVTSHLVVGGNNRLTVAVDNRLSSTTLPPGHVSKNGAGTMIQNVPFDFFNYAGIHRHVRLYSTPSTYIDDITIVTDVTADAATVDYDVTLGGSNTTIFLDVSVNVLDQQGQIVAKGNKLSDKLSITKPTLWWPFGMNDTVGYRYTLLVNVSGDIYRQKFGIRTVAVTENQFVINGKPFYCHGVAKHEDYDLRGKGLDYTLIVKDFNLLRWLGVNCIRTSHYPYAEEILELADSQGVAVIDESPGVGIKGENNFGNISLAHHLEVMSEMIRRDKNKPSVIMWSVANEPATNLNVSVPYFKAVIEHTKTTDPAHRPVTFVSDLYLNGPWGDKNFPYVDVICINRYYGWYSGSGRLEVIEGLRSELESFKDKYKKPVIITEYGADTIAGLHTDPAVMFTEDYQVDFLEEYHTIFDLARKENLIGEMVWNFADFMTSQTVQRVVGNKKGLLTRQRQPKAGAHTIRQRYWEMANGTTDSLFNTNCQHKQKYPSSFNIGHDYNRK